MNLVSGVSEDAWNEASRRAAHHDDPCFAIIFGLDHGVGHSLLLLYDVKVPNGRKSKEFKDLGHDSSNISLSLF